MVLNGEEGLECEFHIDGILVEYVLEFNYLGCILDESGIDGAEGGKWDEGCRCHQVPG